MHFVWLGGSAPSGVEPRPDWRRTLAPTIGPRASSSARGANASRGMPRVGRGDPAVGTEELRTAAPGPASPVRRAEYVTKTTLALGPMRGRPARAILWACSEQVHPQECCWSPIDARRARIWHRLRFAASDWPASRVRHASPPSRRTGRSSPPDHASTARPSSMTRRRATM